ncbi:hypothetical protein SNEBB_002427, partial [Seison nebaliae]
MTKHNGNKRICEFYNLQSLLIILTIYDDLIKLVLNIVVDEGITAKRTSCAVVSSSFEVVCNGKLLFSKLETGKFPVASSVIEEIERLIEGKQPGKITEAEEKCTIYTREALSSNGLTYANACEYFSDNIFTTSIKSKRIYFYFKCDRIGRLLPEKWCLIMRNYDEIQCDKYVTFRGLKRYRGRTLRVRKPKKRNNALIELPTDIPTTTRRRTTTTTSTTTSPTRSPFDKHKLKLNKKKTTTTTTTTPITTDITRKIETTTWERLNKYMNFTWVASDDVVGTAITGSYPTISIDAYTYLPEELRKETFE